MQDRNQYLQKITKQGGNIFVWTRNNNFPSGGKIYSMNCLDVDMVYPRPVKLDIRLHGYLCMVVSQH